MYKSKKNMCNEFTQIHNIEIDNNVFNIKYDFL